MDTAANALETLREEECLALLASAPVGRVGCGGIQVPLLRIDVGTISGRRFRAGATQEGEQ